MELAKYAASLDQMSGGRVILGVGVGAMTEEFESLGVPFRQRGALTNESMAIMRELWTSPDPRYKSERWNLTGFKFAPKPMQQPAIPLWVGGSSPGALRRAATMGDGWHPSGMTPDEFAAGRDEVRKRAAAAGRDPNALTMSLRVEVEVGGWASSPRAASRARLAGDDVTQMIAGIRAYQRAGVEHIVLALNSGDLARIAALMVDIAQKVMPECRQAQGS